MNEGRMLRKRISRSRKFASLSKDAKILFCMLIPHFDPHGKMNGSPNFIKGEVVPYIDELTVPIITKCLREISNKTSVKWFQCEGLSWLHSTNDQEHQNFNKERIRKDLLPSYEQAQEQVRSYSGVDQELVTHKEEEEQEVEEERKTLTTQKALVCASLFEKFWEAYPKKIAKGKSFEIWKRLKPSPEMLERMLSTLRWQTESEDWQSEGGRFIPHPERWLTKKRWLDEPRSVALANPQKRNFSGRDIPI